MVANTLSQIGSMANQNEDAELTEAHRTWQVGQYVGMRANDSHEVIQCLRRSQRRQKTNQQ